MRARVCVCVCGGGPARGPIPAVLLTRKFDVCVWRLPCCVCVYKNSVIEVIPEMANFTDCFLVRVDSSALQHSWYSLLLDWWTTNPVASACTRFFYLHVQEEAKKSCSHEVCVQEGAHLPLPAPRKYLTLSVRVVGR